MAKTGRLELRVEPELLARVEARCEVLGQSRTKFVERALEAALGKGGFQGEAVGALLEDMKGRTVSEITSKPTAPAAKAIPTLKRGSAVSMDYRCPEPSCERVFGSAAAVCPSHGRKAVKDA